MLPNARLSGQLQRRTSELMYADFGYLVKKVFTGEYDDYNNPIYTTSEIQLQCSFTDKPAAERWKSYVDVEELAAEVRFEGSKPDKGDNFKVTGRFGTTVYPEQTYEVIGIRDRGAFGYACALKAVAV